MGCHAFLQGIFPTQQSNPGLPHCRQILYPLSHQESPGNPLKWMGHLPPFTQSYTGPPAAPPRPLHKLLLTKPSVPPSALAGVPLVTPHLWCPKPYLPPSYPGPLTSRGCPLHPPLGMLFPLPWDLVFPRIPGIHLHTYTLLDAFPSPFSPWASPAWLFFLLVEISPSSTPVSLVA